MPVFKCPQGPKWDPPQAGAWYNTDYGNNHNEANLPGASQQAWFQAHPDFGFNETIQASSLPRATDFILLGDAGRSDGTASRGGMYPQPWAFDVSSHQPSTLQLSASALARLLTPFGIRARALRIGNHRARGYQLTDFSKAFDRFLDTGPQSQRD